MCKTEFSLVRQETGEARKQIKLLIARHTHLRGELVLESTQAWIVLCSLGSLVSWEHLVGGQAAWLQYHAQHQMFSRFLKMQCLHMGMQVEGAPSLVLQSGPWNGPLDAAHLTLCKTVPEKTSSKLPWSHSHAVKWDIVPNGSCSLFLWRYTTPRADTAIKIYKPGDHLTMGVFQKNLQIIICKKGG